MRRLTDLAVAVGVVLALVGLGLADAVLGLVARAVPAGPRARIARIRSAWWDG